MQRVRHFWRKVPEMREGVGNAISHPKEALVAPELSQGKRLSLGQLAVPLIPMTKAELHRLVDALPDASLSAATVLLRRARDPVAAKLDAAPYDDEELNDDDLRAIKEARSEPGISRSDAEADLNAS